MKHKSTIIIAGVSLVIVLAWAFFPRRGQPEAHTLSVASWGGAYQAAQRTAFFVPFQSHASTSIREASTPSYSKIYEWMDKGIAPIDVLDVETYFVYQAAEKGALLPIDYSKVDRSTLMDGATHSHGVASCAYADVIAWNSETHPDWKAMTWQDFWNTESYPGPRGLRDLPASTLEAALLADGVLPEQLYPLDVDRAFTSLDKLRAATKIILWSSGSEPVEKLLSGAVTMSTAWNGRIHDAQNEGKALEMSLDGAMIDWLWWVIPKHAPNPELAMEFVAFTMQAENQRRLAENIPYGPTNRDAWPMLSASVKKHLPNSPANLPNAIVRDNAWWAKHDPDVRDRWRSWKLSLNDG